MWEQIRANRRNSVILIIMMAGFMMVVGIALGLVFSNGRLLGGGFGFVIAMVIWVIMTLVAYFGGDTIFLMMSGAKKIKKEDHPTLYNVVEEMQLASGLPKIPAIYIIDDAAPNAFATGRSPETAAVAVTAGLLERLTRDELEGVIAHELAHVKNRDVLYMIMIGVMMGAIVLMADIGVRNLFWGGAGRRRTSSSGGGQAQLVIFLVALVLIILAPIIAQLIYLAVSRKREYLADACSAQYTRYPEGLASALEKISGAPLKLRSATRATAPMYIVNPLNVTKKGLSNLSSTHPPIAERVNILRSMTGAAGFTAYDNAFRTVTGRPVGVVPASALAESQAITKRVPAEQEEQTQLDRVRQTTDMLWSLNNFIFIACSCGTKLKIPPAYSGKKITCPHCGTEHLANKIAS